jgi:hypothetical protein
VSWLGFQELQADSYRLLYQGRWIAQHGLPYHEPFGLAAGNRPFADQQWLAELIHYGVWRLGGIDAVVLLSVLVFSLTFMLLFALVRRRGGSIVVAICCVTIALFGTLTSNFVRAQTLALPLFVALLWLCLEDGDGDRPRASLLVIPLLVLWANIHGSVMLAIGIAIACFGYRAIRAARAGDRRTSIAYGCLAFAALLTPLATPYGTHVLVYYREMLGNPALQPADVEVHPPTYHLFSFVQYLLPLALACGSAIAASARSRRPSMLVVLPVALTAAAAGAEMRNIVWLGIAAALLIAETAKEWIPSSPLARVSRLGLGAGTATLVAVAVSNFSSSAASAFEARVPLRAIAATASYAAAHPCVRVLADDLSASAMLWLDPAMTHRVGFDGELEAYPEASLERWTNFEAGLPGGWSKTVRDYQVLVSSSNAPPLLRRLRELRHAGTLANSSRGVAVIRPGAAHAARAACG